MSVDLVLDLVQSVGTCLVPTLVSTPAKVAGSGKNALGVETSLLVEGDDMRSVGRTEDVAAVTAVVTTKEETKGRATGRGVTAARSRIRLINIC